VLQALVFINICFIHWVFFIDGIENLLFKVGKLFPEAKYPFLSLIYWALLDDTKEALNSLVKKFSILLYFIQLVELLLHLKWKLLLSTFVFQIFKKLSLLLNRLSSNGFKACRLWVRRDHNHSQIRHNLPLSFWCLYFEKNLLFFVKVGIVIRGFSMSVFMVLWIWLP
jgi:hypothetical protein